MADWCPGFQLRDLSRFRTDSDYFGLWPRCSLAYTLISNFRYHWENTMRRIKEADTGLPPLLVDAREAAKIFAIGERRLWSLTYDGQIPCVRIGRSVRYDVRDLTKFIDQPKRG
jgi:Helix-turn-helix domain